MEGSGRFSRKPRKTGDLFAWAETRQRGAKPVKGRYKVGGNLLPPVASPRSHGKRSGGGLLSGGSGRKGPLFHYFQLDHLHTSRRKERGYAVRRNRIVLVLLVATAVIYTIIQLQGP